MISTVVIFRDAILTPQWLAWYMIRMTVIQLSAPLLLVGGYLHQLHMVGVACHVLLTWHQWVHAVNSSSSSLEADKDNSTETLNAVAGMSTSLLTTAWWELWLDCLEEVIHPQQSASFSICPLRPTGVQLTFLATIPSVHTKLASHNTLATLGKNYWWGNYLYPPQGLNLNYLLELFAWIPRNPGLQFRSRCQTSWHLSCAQVQTHLPNRAFVKARTTGPSNTVHR